VALRCGYDVLLRRSLEFIRQELKEQREGPAPRIRVNCDDMGMQFRLFGDRMPCREADGSFLITAEEAKYMPACLYRVE
jgi:hypothetical protein